MVASERMCAESVTNTCRASGLGGTYLAIRGASCPAAGDPETPKRQTSAIRRNRFTDFSHLARCRVTCRDQCLIIAPSFGASHLWSEFRGLVCVPKACLAF